MAHLYGQIDRVPVEVHVLDRIGDDHGDVAMAGIEVLQPGNQPLGREGGVGLQPQRAVRAAAHDLVGGAAYALEGRRDGLAVALTGLCEADAVALAPEQLHAQVGLQHVQLLAHGGLADVQLPGGQREVARAHHHLEDLQGLSGGILPCMAGF